MSQPPSDYGRWLLTCHCVSHLRDAIDCAKRGGAPRTHAYLRRALKSAIGARNHAFMCMTAAQRGQKVRRRRPAPRVRP
jgi:hypothetical protein